jgi:benzoyl-CoA reductase subunit C
LDSKLDSKVLTEFSEAAGMLANPSIDDWKANGGNVIGYYCTSMPMEVLTAAGCLPFRVRATGSTDTELSDACFFSINCSFVRHSFNVALAGGFDFLDGVVVLSSCDHVRRVYDHWKRKMKTPFVQIMSLPRKAEEAQVVWFRDEISNLIKAMEEHFKVRVTDENLSDAIEIHNKTRRLQKDLYELRKTENPPITGSEALAVTVASTAMPGELYNQKLDTLINELKGTEGHKDYKARLMVMGAELDNPGYIEVIEGQGGLVVTDSLCYGTRMFWREIDETGDDPLTAIARFYISERPSCPRVYGKYEDRSGFVKKMIEDFNVDGVILERLTFCDAWGFEQFTIKNEFEDWGIPLMMLDREYTLSGVGQLKTRVQAFLEAIGGE